MKANPRLSEAPQVEKVSRGILVTLLSVKNGGSDQSVDEPIDSRTEGGLLVRPRDISPPSMGLDLYLVVFL